MATYHVSKNGSLGATGTKQDPFLTLNATQSVVKPGDLVLVHEGIYREWFKPSVKGLSDQRRITYEAAPGAHVSIKGSEIIDTWVHVEGHVYQVTLPNTFFGDYNPFKEELFGDWLMTIEDRKHLGDVYLNGRSFYEVKTYEQVLNPEPKTESYDFFTQRIVPIKDVKQTTYVWMCEVDATQTTIYANFHGADPNQELVEINVRKACFLPVETGIDYITVKGFHMSQAATPYSPPTADQPGLLGPNWSKGWIIEDNVIHDAKCSAISIGKEKSTGHLYRSIRGDKPGYQYQLEAVFSALRNGWSKEKIGSHIIRRNRIYDCGQNGIVGHLGCVFSHIYDNHIYNIGVKREFFGWEIGGIKFHAAIDTQIEHNRIHDCALGLWLDWQTQGTQVHRNLFYQNGMDFFVEVSHGPYVASNNIFASPFSLHNMAQGGAYINNLVGGFMVQRKVLNRSTQYHLPHSTQVAGFSMTYGGDDRFMNNLFLGKAIETTISGTAHYNGAPDSLEAYLKEIANYPGGDLEEFLQVEQPVYIKDNAYFNDAKAYDKEIGFISNEQASYEILDEGDHVYLTLHLPESFKDMMGEVQGTHTLSRTRIVDQEFDCPDGSALLIDFDYSKETRSTRSSVGPFATLKPGMQKVRVW